MVRGKKYLLALNCSEEIGPRGFKDLRKAFRGDWERVWRESPRDLIRCKLPQRLVDAVLRVRKKANPEKEVEKLKAHKVKTVVLGESLYPSLLANLFDPPQVLYYLGSLGCLRQQTVAVVGARRASQYGREVAEDIAKYLGEAGICVVSGLALGIDGVAHGACLSARGKTLAVLASGLNRIYPASHFSLAQKIIQSDGAIISEYPLGFRPQRYHFPIRNRIIAGLSRAVVVVEAGAKSGSLITARIALEEGREVLAVPHSIYNRQGEGTNNLIKQGALPIINIPDVLLSLGIERKSSAKNRVAGGAKLSELEKKITQLLKEGTKQTNELARLCAQDAQIILQSLSRLEIVGIVKKVGALGWALVC